MIDLSTLLPVIAAALGTIIAVFIIREKFKEYHDTISALQWQLDKEKSHIASLKTELAKPQTAPLSIEAQQILHDMTAHGKAIVQITPLSPADIFWRAP